MCDEVADLSACPGEHFPPTCAVPGAGAGRVWVQLLPAFPLQVDKWRVCLEGYRQTFRLAAAVHARAGGLKPSQGTEVALNCLPVLKTLLAVSQIHHIAGTVCKAPLRLFLPERTVNQELRGFLLAEMPRRPLEQLPKGLAHLGGGQCYHRRSPRSHGL